ncbi:MAG: hypothetical protein QM677_08680 [Microbacterium sp.]
MAVTSVLIAGSGGRAYLAAAAFARCGIETALIDGSATGPADRELEHTVRALAVDVRRGVELIGAVDVDRHVEAELTGDRVENFDAIVLADAPDAQRFAGLSVRVFVLGAADDAARLVRLVRLARSKSARAIEK